MTNKINSQGVPVIHVAPSTNQIMWSVAAATLPGMMVLLYFQGTRWLGLSTIAILSAWCCEAILLALRGKPHIARTLADGSITVTALLLVLSLPVSAPTWLVVIGVCFAVIFGKQLYGGLGMNPFNPAMVGFCFLLISFPAFMGQQPAHSIALNSFWQSWDATTAATVLDKTHQLRIATRSVSEITIHSSHILLAIAWTIGGVWLAIKRYLDWRLAVSVLLSAYITATIFCFINPDNYLPAFIQLFSGATIFGAWFIATDPVTASTTPLGRICYGSLIGILTICIRNLGNFPDGFAFAVLLANSLVPILDRLTRPRYC